MIRVETTDELAVDALWSLGAIAVALDDAGLVAGFDNEEDERAALAVLARWPVVRLADDDRWDDAWRRSLTPVTIGPLTVRPAWERGPGITIEPGRAFGSGSHATTRLAIEALLDVVVAGDAVLDVGTGTGVLALAAAQLGARRVLAIDISDEAITVATANVAANRRVDVIAVSQQPLGDVEGAFDVVVANLGGVLTPVALAPDLARCTRRTLIVSGLLDENQGGLSCALVDDALRPHGLEPGTRWSSDGWSARCYRRTDDVNP